MSLQPIFDGHNDLLSRLWINAARGADPVAEFERAGRGHIDKARAREGGLFGGISAIYVPSEQRTRVTSADGSYRTPLAAAPAQADALKAALEMADIAGKLHDCGAWALCRDVAAIEQAAAAGMFAAVLHLEGCEPIGPDLAELELFRERGLRSLGPVWSRDNIFGHGVPFAFPCDPDTGPGLTDAGRRLVTACADLGILIDLAHITEKGFWDVAEIDDRPLVVSHSNAHALTPVARNLTDRQLDAVAERRGIVGLNFAVSMLRDDGRSDTDTPLAACVRHIDHLVERMGIDCVGLGSDFDGAPIPRAIGDASGLPRLVNALSEAGYGADELDQICRTNWLRVLKTVWRER